MEMNRAQQAEYEEMEAAETALKNAINSGRNDIEEAKDLLKEAEDFLNEAEDGLSDHQHKMEIFLEDNNISDV